VVTVAATVYAHAMPGHDDLAAAAWEKFQKDAGRSKEPRKSVKPRRARKSA